MTTTPARTARKDRCTVNRIPLLVAATAVLTVPAAATANVAATCTTDGVQITLSNFHGTHYVPWTVTQDGATVAAGKQKVTGATTFTVPTPGVTGTVTVTATWGPVPARDTGIASTLTACAPTPPVIPPDPEPTPDPTPASLEPPRTSTPIVTITPITTPRPPVRKPLTCKQLRARGAGHNTLVRRGCVKAKSTRLRVCAKGRYRVVVRGKQYCLVNPPRPVRPAVTG